MKKMFVSIAISGAMLGLLSLLISEFNYPMLIYKLCGFCLFILSLDMGLLKDKDYVSPYCLFAIAPFCILIYSEKASPVYLPLPGGITIFNILIGQLCFLLGLTLLRLHFRKYRQATHFREGQFQSKGEYSYVFLCLLGILPFMLSLFLNPMGIQLAVGNMDEYRTTFHIPIISALTCYLTGALLFAASTNRRKAFVIILSLALTLGLFTQARGNVVVLLLVVLFSLHRYWKGRYSKTIVLLALVIFVAVFQLYSMIRQEYFYRSDQISSYEYYKIAGDLADVPLFIQSFYSTYIYMTTPLSNFDYIVEQIDSSTNGMLTLWPLISTFQIKRLYDIDQFDKPIRMWPYNTHSFLGDFYLDFGTIGIIILPVLLGMLVYWIYLRSLKSNDCLIHAEYIYFGFATFMMFFSNHFTSIAYPLRIFILFEIYRFFSKRFKLKLQKAN